MLIGIARIDCLLNEDTYKVAYENVSSERRLKADKVKGADDKRRCVASAILLNHMVKAFVEKMPLKSGVNEVDLLSAIPEYDKNYEYEVRIREGGKPEFVHHGDIKYSLSHAGDYVACVVSDNEVGIDIEGDRPINYKVSNRFFSEEENMWVEQGDNEALKKERFFRLWTAKEAFAKVTGIGLARSIENVHFYETKCGILSICETDFVDKYGLSEYRIENYQITVAFLK